jgi:catechol 2,3-dioxygenase-like lactoylglutathione lyase family enzyme
MRLNQVTLASTDIERSVRFYRCLGLLPIVLTDHYARLVCPEGQATLSLDRVEVAPISAHATVVYFECDDLDVKVAALKAAGVVFASDARDEPWLWRGARLADPDGNPLCLYFAGRNRLDPPWRVPAELA